MDGLKSLDKDLEWCEAFWLKRKEWKTYAANLIGSISGGVFYVHANSFRTICIFQLKQRTAKSHL